MASFKTAFFSLKLPSLFYNNTFFKIFNHKFSSKDLKQHQEKVMSKGLPVKKPIEGVKHTILISSGKGGVGKSTTSVNLATALKFMYPDKKIGLLDCDVFGPSVPLMMNLHETPLVNDKNQMLPLTNYGVKCMSMGFLIAEGSPVIWRGLMVMQALEKLLRHVEWGRIDYLIVDTPPGTGDTHLSLVQNIPISGVVLITTPQPAALEVTKRGAAMYKKLSVPIIGLVENMASVTCPSCYNKVEIFGDGTSHLANEIGTNIIQSFPLDHKISSSTDKGTPVVIKHPDSCQTKAFVNLANKVVDFLEKNNE
ncbi:iron-sulfur protein NUBPL [Tribolium madens]|uniref:iron-sulfur protein NUBPL n=1 Tax=Tribolium madens TaxID=41895 RepID=UPI001CF726A9|nr:iron-sulfur protein NUBPL [Tribolium madens]